MKLSDLQEKRASILEKMKTAIDDDTAFKTLETELGTLDQRIARQRTLDAADRDELGTPIGKDERFLNEVRSRFSLSRAIAHAAGLDVDAGYEREVQKELARRAGKPAQGFYCPTEIFEPLSATERRVLTTSTGSEIMPTDYRPGQFINALAAATVIRSLGATVLTGLTGNVSIPRETASPQVGWVAENAALPNGDPDFDSVTLSPHHVGVISEFSRNMLLQANPTVESLLRKMMARNIAQAIDKAAIRGGGANEPVGILGGTSGIQTVTGDTDIFTAAADAVALADIANVDASRAFLTNNVLKKIASKALDGQGRPVGIANVFGNERVAFSNLAVNDGNSPANNPLIYADWSELLLAIWSELDILVNPFESTAYSKGNVSIRAMATVDVGVRHPAAFVSVTGVTGSIAAMPASP